MAASTPRRKPTPRKPAATGRVTPAKAKTNGKTGAVPDGRLRLLKVMVQPTYAYDTADGLIEITGPVEQINGVGWIDWSRTAFSPLALDKRRAELTVLEGSN